MSDPSLQRLLRAAAAVKVGDVKFFLHWEQMLLFDPVEPVDSGCCPSLRAVMENKTQPFCSQTWKRTVFTALTSSTVLYSLLFKGPNARGLTWKRWDTFCPAGNKPNEYLWSWTVRCDLKLTWNPPLSRCLGPVEMFTHRQVLEKLTGSWEMISGCFFNN